MKGCWIEHNKLQGSQEYQSSGRQPGRQVHGISWINLFLSCKKSQQIIPADVSAPLIIAGRTYQIVTTGTTDFTFIGAADNNPGTIFTATGAGTGTGTAAPFDFTLNKSATTDGILVIINGIVQDPEGGAVYSVSGTTLTFTSVLTSSDVISVRFLEF